MQRAIAVVCFCLASGCAVGPDYQTPELPLPESYAEAIAPQSETTDELLWWGAFKDETLNGLMYEAVQGNKEVAQALSRINQSRALAQKALSSLLPGLELNATYEKGKNSGARFPSGSSNDSEMDGVPSERRDTTFTYEVFTAGVDAAWEIDIFGRLRRELESRNAEHAATVASLQDAIRMLVAEVGTTYFQLRGAQAQLAIAEANLALQQETARVAQVKFDTGLTSELDTLRAVAQLEATRASVPPLVAAVKTNTHRLSLLLGKQPQELAARLVDRQEIPEYAGPIAFGSPTDLLRRRPDIRIAERRLAAETARIGAATAELYPIIQISGSLGVEAPSVSGFNNGAGAYRFGPSITWRPFDNGTLRAEIRRQRAKAEESLFAYEHAVLTALSDVENSFVEYNSQQQRRFTLDRAFAAATKAAKIAQEQYAEGAVDLLTVLNAQQTALDIERDLVSSQQGTATAIVAMYKAFGGGWELWQLREGDGNSRPEVEQVAAVQEE